MNNVAIVGLGLIGGSLALALSKRGFVVRASDIDTEQVELARLAGLDVRNDLPESLRQHPPEALVICTPVSTIAAVARAYQEALSESDTPIFHAGSLLSAALLGLDEDVSANVLGTHPLAGDTSSGFHAANGALFSGCTVVVESRATAAQISAARAIWSAAGAASVVKEDAREHDRRMAVVSHLPQLASTLLALTIAQQGLDAADLGPGGRDATRLARSPFPMWRDILQSCTHDLVPLLQTLQANVGALSDSLSRDDWVAIEQLWKDAAAIYDNPPHSVTAPSGRPEP
jgi:prephenate dehydrogenase